MSATFDPGEAGRSVAAEILTIGDEILRGEIVDSNKAWLAERLLTLGVEARFQTSVGDHPEDMTDAFRHALRRSDWVLISGGLGPTRDDLTIEVLAHTLGRKLVLDAPSLRTIEAFFRRFGRPMPPINAKQARFPEGAEILANPIGTAPGCWVEHEGTIFVCLPGVPGELARMMDEQVLPRLARRLTGREVVVRSTLLRTFGAGESSLDERLHDVATEPGTHLGFRTSFPDNLLRPVVHATSAEEADAKLARVCALVRERLGPLVYGEGEGETLEVVTLRLLRERGERLAVAESCTGGLLAQRITSVAGASDVFLGGIVAYSNAAKNALLGVDDEALATHGAVSEPVARALAEGARERFGADWALATTGISGPGGGSPEKPVGLVYVALAREEAVDVQELFLPFDRARHRLLTSQVALEWVRRALLGLELALPRWGRRPR